MPSSMLFLNLSFLLSTLLLFWWIYLSMLFVFFSLTVFSILSLFFVLVVLTIICHREVLFWSYLFGVLEASCTWMDNFLEIWEINFLLFFKIYYIYLRLAPPLLLQCEWFTGLVFDGIAEFLHISFVVLECFV
jgi:hypothetical protein